MGSRGPQGSLRGFQMEPLHVFNSEIVQMEPFSICTLSELSGGSLKLKCLRTAGVRRMCASVWTISEAMEVGVGGC